jgi:hypothetical protein
MHMFRQRWRFVMPTVALGLILGILATPFGIAHVHFSADVCAPDLRSVQSASPRSLVTAGHSSHQHCPTCDWLQHFRSTLLVSITVAMHAEVVRALPADVLVERDFLRWTSVPARAPPA